jgi:ectoine hydroxylase-related dioxygenase (phytanoyl-CoA dioxygenase family)
MKRWISHGFSETSPSLFKSEKTMPLQEAIEHLDTFGYCVIEDAIPAERADQMAAKYFQLHEDSANRPLFQNPNDELYQTLFGVINMDEMCWDCIAHPQVLAVVRHFLGEHARLGEACTKWVKPTAPAGGIHADSTHDLPAQLPDQPWMINTIWMITDFTKANGATVVVPFSHRLRRRPSPELVSQSPQVSVGGRRGSVLLWQGATWHGQGANTTRDQHRMALNIAYYPAWWNLMREGGHQPVLPETFARMPEYLQDLVRHKVARERADIYEF